MTKSTISYHLCSISELNNDEAVYRTAPATPALLHKLRELSHLCSLIKIAFATIAVSLHWPVLPG